MSKIRVAVLFGGRSAEHDISVISARSIMAAMDPARYEVVPIGVTREGGWLTGGDPRKGLSAPGAGGANGRDGDRSRPHPNPLPEGEGISHPLSLWERAGAGALRASRPVPVPPVDVVFPVLHGPLGEDGTVQGML